MMLLGPASRWATWRRIQLGRGNMMLGNDALGSSVTLGNVASHPVIEGNLSLVCSRDPQRENTFISSQSFSAPFHLSKSYWDGHSLLINVVNQTAGIFGGDALRSRVVVEPGAQVLLTCPSAARFHPSKGRESRLEQQFEVRAGGFLDVFPQLSIPQRDSSSRQKTEIVLEPGAELVYFEALAPGRVASGEVFAFDRYVWSTKIRVGEHLVYLERGDIEPEKRPCSLAGLRALFPSSYYASVVVISPKAEVWKKDFAEEVKGLLDPTLARIGASQLTGSSVTLVAAFGWSIRVLAADSLTLHDAVERVREVIYEKLRRAVPKLRRV